jgi:hypothetical protein
MLSKHEAAGRFKAPCKPQHFELPPRPGFGLPCRHATLDGELQTYDSSRGLYRAIVFVRGHRISLGIYCSRSAGCAAIAEAVDHD